MSSKKESAPITEDKPQFRRDQVFKEDQFNFPDKAIEDKIMKIVHENKADLMLFKKAIFYTETFKEESNYYEWNTSTRAHNNINGKYDIDINLHLNKDVPDLSELQHGKYRLVIKFYNPSKRTKNRLFGCVDTQSIDFVVGASQGSSERALKGMSTPAPVMSQLNQLAEIGQVVDKVGEILNKSLDIHKNTMVYKDQIERTAYEKGYKDREEKERSEKLVNDLMARLEALEAAKSSPVPAVADNTLMKTLIEAGKKIGIIPADLPLDGLSPEQIVNLVVGMTQKTGA
jgi:hypothetical protein